MKMPKVLYTSNVKLFLKTLHHVQAGIFPGPCHGVTSAGPIYPMVSFDIMKKLVRPNSSHKIGSIRDGCPFFINKPKILSTNNVR
jgi:hypothetical protein